MIHYEFSQDATPKMNELAHISAIWDKQLDLSFLDDSTQILAFFSCSDGFCIVYNTAPKIGKVRITNMFQDELP